jgi:hypothetical protein
MALPTWKYLMIQEHTAKLAGNQQPIKPPTNHTSLIVIIYMMHAVHRGKESSSRQWRYY